MQADIRANSTARILGLLERLERALEDEAGAVATRDPETLLGAVESKRMLLRELGTELTTSGLERRLASMPRSGIAADPTLAALVERLIRCRTLNEIAGGAIAASLNNTRDALRHLGMPSEQKSYGATRRKAGHSTGRSIAFG